MRLRFYVLVPYGTEEETFKSIPDVTYFIRDHYEYPRLVYKDCKCLLYRVQGNVTVDSLKWSLYLVHTLTEWRGGAALFRMLKRWGAKNETSIRGPYTANQLSAIHFEALVPSIFDIGKGKPMFNHCIIDDEAFDAEKIVYDPIQRDIDDDIEPNEHEVFSNVRG